MFTTTARRRTAARYLQRTGVTLAELAVAMVVMSLVAMVLGGLTHAVQTARQHVRGLHQASAVGRLATRRIKLAIDQAGVYQSAGQSTQSGLAVCCVASGAGTADMLIVFDRRRITSATDRQLAGGGTLGRLPKASELTVFAPDPTNPRRLLEVTDDNATGNVDFNPTARSTLDSKARQILVSSTATKSVLGDRLRSVTLNGSARGAIWFGEDKLPTDAELAAVTPGTSVWRDLSWVGGASSQATGVRQVIVRCELQLETGTDDAAASLPIFGRGVRRFVYRPAGS